MWVGMRSTRIDSCSNDTKEPVTGDSGVLISRKDELAMDSEERKDYDERMDAVKRGMDREEDDNSKNWEDSSVFIRPQGSWTCRECGFNNLPRHVKCDKLTFGGSRTCVGTQTGSWGGLAIGAKPPPEIRPRAHQMWGGLPSGKKTHVREQTNIRGRTMRNSH